MSSAAPNLTGAEPPPLPPASLFARGLARVRPYIPGRGWLIFLGTLGGVSALFEYDRREKRRALAALAVRASVVATQPVHFHQRLRHVLVLLAPDQFARSCFDDFVKPVFDAGALDYTVVDAADAVALRRAVADRLWTGRDELAAAQQHDQQQRTAAAAASPWSPARWFARAPAPEHPVERLLRDAAKVYRPEDALVAVGPEAWDAVLAGIHDGVAGPRPPSVPAVADDSAAANGPTDASGPSAFDAFDAAAAEAATAAPPGLPPGMELPPLAYIPSSDLTGWSYVPRRIYKWFSHRVAMRSVGEEALKVVLEGRREFQPESDPALADTDRRPAKEPRNTASSREQLDPITAASLTVYC
ncbi:mitochondrial import inner membrane translocase subunit tim54 [Cladochytrium tenue]|nr:mitochondrial import inner membrane translocase subunit tim54 [Cladochytrium tenue]